MCGHSPRIRRQDLASPGVERVGQILVSSRWANPVSEAGPTSNLFPGRQRLRDPLHERSAAGDRSVAGQLVRERWRVRRGPGPARRWGGEALVEEIVRVDVCRSVEEALAGLREQLADAVLGAFVAVCPDLPGKLILVLDQAEEVLTRSRGGRIGDEASAAFFHFLEDIYLRNVDARLVVALRTEYYGRFATNCGSATIASATGPAAAALSRICSGRCARRTR
jgi:hypothetical protein